MRVSQCAVTIFVLVLAATIVGKTDSPVTVLLKSGEKISGQSYDIDNEFKVFTLFIDDDQKKVSFSKIEAIHNEAGDNIAADLLGKFYTPGSGKWRSSSSKVFKKARQKYWTTRIEFDGGFNIPTGNYYEGIESSAGFGGNIVFALTHELGLRIMVSKPGMKINQNTFVLYSFDPNFTIVSQDFSVKATRYVLGLEYYRSVNRSRPGTEYFFLYSGLGAIKHSFQLDMTVRENSSGTTASESSKVSESNFVTNIGLGYIRFLSDIVGLTTQASIDFVYAEGRTSNGASAYDIGGVVFDFSVGIVFSFGGISASKGGER